MPVVYEEICEQVRQNLMVQLGQWLSRRGSDPSLPDLHAMRDEAFRQVLDDSKLTSLALEAQKHPAGSLYRKHALDNFIAALWLMHFSRKTRRSLLEEEAVSETLKYICENIDQFQPERDGRSRQVMAWIEYQRKVFLGKAQQAHETQPNRLLQPDKARKRIIGFKYELTCLITKLKRENLLSWIRLAVKRLVPEPYSRTVVLLLAAMLSIAQLRTVNPREVDSLLFAIAEQVLTPPRLETVSTSQDGESEESSFWEKLPQPEQPKFMSEELRAYLRTDPYGILQKSVKGRPEATFQAIAQKYLEGQSWYTIAESFGASRSNFSTFSTFYSRQLEKLAPQIREHLQERLD